MWVEFLKSSGSAGDAAQRLHRLTAICWAGGLALPCCKARGVPALPQAEWYSQPLSQPRCFGEHNPSVPGKCNPSPGPASPGREPRWPKEDGSLWGREEQQEEDREETCCSRGSQIVGRFHGRHELHAETGGDWLNAEDFCTGCHSWSPGF